jgi:uncharacterized protein YqjF (DUF2071 family)
MFPALKRHPLAIEAFFEHSLVLTFAFEPAALQSLLPPGLVLDTCEGSAFLAIALVRTRALRPQGWPAFLGRDFFLSGYRLFVRFRSGKRRYLRGLYVLRSDANSAGLVHLGNLLTHYRYRLAQVTTHRTAEYIDVRVRTLGSEADLDLRADLTAHSGRPPASSPFRDLETARKYSGPLPYTFDYEAETHGIVVVKGVRKVWNPRPLDVDLRQVAYLERQFPNTPVRLANAFLVENVPYRWKPGRLVPLGEAP